MVIDGIIYVDSGPMVINLNKGWESGIYAALIGETPFFL